MLKTWVFNLPQLWDEAFYLSLARNVFSRAELNRLTRITHARRRKEYILTHLLARFQIASVFGMKPEELSFEFDAMGKPHIYFNQTEFFVSLSHSDNWAVVAFSETPVGVDVEALTITENLEAIASHYQEYHQVIDLPVSERQEVFTQFWTLREALFKLMGREYQNYYFKRQGQEFFILEKNNHTKCTDWNVSMPHLDSGHVLSVLSNQTNVEMIRVDCFDELAIKEDSLCQMIS